MPDAVDEILAALNASTEDETPEDEKSGADDSSTIKDMRAKLKKQAADQRVIAKALEEATGELTTIREKARTDTAKAVFKGLELPEEQATLFLKGHEGEVTPEAIKQFVVDYKLPAKMEGLDTMRTTDQKSEGFIPGGTNDAEAPGQGKVSRKELDSLIYTDPARANKLIAEGRVDMTREK